MYDILWNISFLLNKIFLLLYWMNNILLVHFLFIVWIKDPYLDRKNSRKSFIYLSICLLSSFSFYHEELTEKKIELVYILFAYFKNKLFKIMSNNKIIIRLKEIFLKLPTDKLPRSFKINIIFKIKNKYFTIIFQLLFCIFKSHLWLNIMALTVIFWSLLYRHNLKKNNEL